MFRHFDHAQQQRFEKKRSRIMERDDKPGAMEIEKIKKKPAPQKEKKANETGRGAEDGKDE